MFPKSAAVNWDNGFLTTSKTLMLKISHILEFSVIFLPTAAIVFYSKTTRLHLSCRTQAPLKRLLYNTLLFDFTWFPPMPWQLKMPTFSFSLRPMLSKHWLVSTFLIWRKRRNVPWRKMAANAMFVQKKIRHCRRKSILCAFNYLNIF